MSKRAAAGLLATFYLMLALAGGPLLVSQASAQESVKTHALTLNDAPKYPADFKHLDYVNPDAPKGGTVRYAAPGSFDSFNPFIVNGDPAALSGFYEALTTRTDDDDMTGYGLI